MKHYIYVALIILSISKNSSAGLVGPHYSYYHIPTSQKIDPYKFDDQKGTAVYFDHASGKKRTVKTSDLSKETFEEINHIKAGKLVLLNKEGLNFCETFNLFENGMVFIGCQTDREQMHLGRNSAQNIHLYVNATELLAEVDSLEGFDKKEKVTLLKAAGRIEKGSRVRIEALFPNGEALIQKFGINLIDTSTLRLKRGIELVQLKDLEKASH